MLLFKKLPKQLFRRAFASPPPTTPTPYGKFFFKNLAIEDNMMPKAMPKHDANLGFGKYFTDHMLVCDWDATNGWSKPYIKPYQNLTLEPSCTVFHYAIECFEGMKAYSSLADKDTKFLFRPSKNLERLNESCLRLAFPTFKSEEMLKCIAKLIDIDKHWIPQIKGYSLYIRPTLIATQNTLGVGAANRVKFFTILSPSGPYYPKGFKPVRLLADPTFVRACKGGTGNKKLGANYAPTIYPQLLANKAGYDQLLWLTDSDHKITEVGAMNIMFYWEDSQGNKVLNTAPLDDGVVLPGITRDSVLQLAKMQGITVNEGVFTIKDVVNKIEENKMLEVFGTGTAAIVSPVSCVSYKGVDYSIPCPSPGLATNFFNTLLDIQHGVADEHYGWRQSLEEILQ